MNLAPIVLFVYNRLDHTRQTIEALQKNDLANESELYIYSDAAKDNYAESEVLKVREYINTVSGFKEIHIVKRADNWGLANSIIDGVTHIVNQYGKIIVIEDDIVTSPGFLNYMNEALTLYKDDKKIMHIAGYLPETSGQESLPNSFFLRFMSCWGWATWKDSWSNANWDAQYLFDKINTKKALKKFNLNNAISFHRQLEDNINGSITTWAIKWFSTIFIYDGLCLYPHKSFVKNIGLDGSGVHSGIDTSNSIDELLTSINLNRIELKESRIGKKYLMRFYKYGKYSSFKFRIHHNVNNFRNKKVSTVKKVLRKISAKL